MNVGVFIGQAMAPGEINASALAAYAANLPSVKHVRILGFRPRLDPTQLADELRREQIAKS